MAVALSGDLVRRLRRCLLCPQFALGCKITTWIRLCLHSQTPNRIRLGLITSGLPMLLLLLLLLYFLCFESRCLENSFVSL